jgi:glycosyltransferase involved in cell wall biosynthesis
MHIGFVLIPYQWYSGTAEYYHNLYSELIKLDTENKYTVFLPSDAPKRALDYFGQGNCIKTGIPSNPGSVRYAMTMFGRYFEAHGRDIDVLHCFNFPVPRFGKKVVLTVYDMRELDLPGTYDHMHRMVMGFIRRGTLKRVDHVTTISEFSRSRIVSYYPLCDKKISLCCPGIDPLHIRSIKREMVPYGRPYILTVGHLVHHKNHINLIRAFNRLCQNPDFHHDLIVIGKNYGSNEFVRNLKDAVEHKPRVIFADQVSDEMLSSYYHHADLFVFPSLYEGFGIPLLEAFACNVPVAASRIPVFQEVYGFNDALFDPLDPANIAAVVGNMVHNKEARSASIRIGSESLGRYTWKATADSTLEVYRKVG